MRLVLLVAAVLTLAGVGPVSAHTRSESHSSWLVDGSSVHLNFSMPDLEAARLSPDGRRPDDAQIVAYLQPLVGATAGGADCALAAPAHPVSSASGYRRFEFLFQCPSSDDIVLRSAAFFDLVLTHVNLAQVQTGAGAFVENVLTADKHELEVEGQDGKGLENAGFLTFVKMGMMHIFTGLDHQSFLLGMVLISRRVRDLGLVVTGFTLGHSLTLALAFTGVLRPHAEFIDALIALTITLIAIENVSVATRRPGLLALSTGGALVGMAVLRLFGVGLMPPLLLLGAGIFAANYLMLSGHLRDAARLRLVVTLVFGLIHGFGFAADLLSEPIPPGRLAELLAGFNIGVEIGQLSTVFLLMSLVFVLGRLRLTLPRPIVVDVAAAGLVAVGMYWFVSRSFA
jgi:hypothetical protein